MTAIGWFVAFVVAIAGAAFALVVWEIFRR